jgi:uncharacterized repeat protein (TIGR01451 family)
MRNIIDYLQDFIKNRWFRLCSSLALAFALASILLFMPVAAGKTIRVPLPALPHSGLETSNWHSGRTLDLPLPIGAPRVGATGGLTITKIADASTVDQGGVLTYTLTVVNQTGSNLEGVIIVTDTLPANTSCGTVFDSSDGRWFGNEVLCDNGQATWVFPGGSSFGVFTNGTRVDLVYTVLVDEPLPNQSQIVNTAFTYGVSATTYADLGTIDVTTSVNAPEWQISKSVTPTPSVQAGAFLTYTLHVTNVGAMATSGTFYVVDSIPANTTFDSASGNYTQTGTQPGDVVTWTISTPLAPGQAIPADLAPIVTVVVTSPLTNGLTITNAGYRVFGANVYTGEVGPPVVSTVRSQAQLQANKRANAAAVAAGDLITYTLTVTNLASANGPAQNVVVTDPLTSEVLYEGMGFIPPATGTVEHPPFGNSGVVRWTLANAIQPGDSIQVYLVGRVRSPLANGTSLTNRCTAGAANALAPVTCPPLANTVASAPSLSLGKSVTPAANVSPEGTVTYTLVISNTGNETASGVTITDTLGLAFSPTLVTWTGVTVPGRPTYGTLGTQTLVFTASAPVVPGIYYNTAITATYASRQATAANLAPIVVGAPDLRIHKSVTPAAVIAGDVLTYTIIYSNASGAPATGVWITDTLEANLTFESASPSPDVSQAPDYAWNVGALSQADGEGSILVTARVAPDVPDGTLVGNSVAMTSEQGVGASYGPVNATVLAPELHVVKSDAGYDPIDAGGVLTYTITYSNTGGADAHNVRITDTLDANVSFVWASLHPDVSSPPVYVWVIENLPANSGPQTLTVAVRVDRPLANGTMLANDVTIKGDEPFSDSDHITTMVQSAPAFQVSKTAWPSPATPGQPLTYTIVFTNVGNAVASGVRITDTLDSHVIFQSSVPNISGSAGSQIYWDWPDLVGVDDPQTITVNVLVTSPLANGTLLWNNVEVGSSQGGADTTSISTPVQSAPDLHVTKTATPSVVQPGGTITYSIYYSNTGTATTDAVITDVLDPYVDFVDATPPNVLSSSDVIWNVAGLSPLSGTQVLTLVVSAAPVLPDGALLINHVTIAGDGSSDSDTATTRVESVDLVVSKSVLPAGEVQAGGWITYSITFYNAGGMDATGVVITDTLPLSLTDVSYSVGPGVNLDSGPSPYVWNAGTLSGGESGAITISGQLLPSPWPSTGAWLTNTVEIGADQAEAVATTSNNTASVTNLGVPGVPYTVTVSAVPAETTVGTDVAVSASVTDQYGNPVRDGTMVYFSSLPLGSSVSVTPLSASTTGGQATTTLSSVVSATVTVTATAGSAIDSADVLFHPGSLHHFAVGVSSPQTAGIAFTTVITALDQYDNVVGFDGAVALADTTGTLIAASPPALVSGRGAVSVTVYTATSADEITATWVITPISGVSDPFVVLPGEPATLAVTMDPATIRVCQTAAVTTTIRDAWSNPVPGQLVSLTVIPGPPPSNAVLVPPSGNTDAAGVFQSTLQGLGAGNVRIFGESGALNNAANMPSVSITTPPVPTALNLSVAPNPLYTGGATAVVTATVSDCLGLSSGQAVTFTLSDPSLAWLPGPSDTYVATTNASGVATAPLTSNSTPAAGTLTITGTLEGLVDVVTLNVALEPRPSLSITKTATPPGGDVRPGQSLNYTVVARNTGGAEATGVVISDTLPAGVTLVSRSASGGTITSDAPLRVTGSLPAGEAITLSIEVAVTSEVSGTLLSNQASVDSNETLPASSQVVSHRVVTNTGTVFLPIILNNWTDTTPPAPPDVNLVIDSLSFVGSPPVNDGDKYHLQVVVRNAGPDPVTTDFWVDLYLNPVSTPAPNQPWQNLSQSGVDGVSKCPSDPTCYGRAWLVTADLAPGASVTLSTQAAADWRYDRWPVEGVPYASSRHNPMVALVDSWGFAYGAVSESNEGDNLSSFLSGSGLRSSEFTLGLPASGVPAWPPGSQRPGLPGP